MSFLLDTDICSLHTRDDRRLFPKFLQYLGQLHVSAITVGELATWSHRASASTARRKVIRQFLADIHIIDVDSAIADAFGQMRAMMLDQGRDIATADGFIAATALVHDLTLVTHNTKDFAVISGLKLADWLAT